MQFVWALAALVASYLISALTAKRPEEMKPRSFGEDEFPQAEEGTPQAVVFGDCWTGDWMVLWHGNYRTSAIKSSSGGKK